MADKKLKPVKQSKSERAEELIEKAFWDFDAAHKGYNGRNPISERDAFKHIVRGVVTSLGVKL